MQEKRVDDYWNVDSNRSLSDSWKGFTKFTTSQRKYVVREETNKKIKQLPDLRISCLNYGAACQQQLRKKGKVSYWAIEKPKLDNARRLRGIYFIDPDDQDYKSNSQKCKERIGKTHGSDHAVQKESSK